MIVMNYYDVGIGLEKHWDNSQFTYSFEGIIDDNSLVIVPFGNKNVIGIVTNKSVKPKFKTRNINAIMDLSISTKFLQFSEWYKNYYSLNSAQLYKQLLPPFLSKKERQNKQMTTRPLTKNLLNPLNNLQQMALNSILSNDRSAAIHGITGSGKTRLYIAAIKNVIDSGKDALVLLPEISLTPQVVSEVSSYFSNSVLYHSQLTDSERRSVWKGVCISHEPTVIIGTRSALFLPISNLGIIIIDEAHDPSYKQDSGTRYNSLYVAGGLAKTHGAKLLIGSATLPVTETQQLIRAGGELLCMHERAVPETKEPEISIVNLKSRDDFNEHPKISNMLLRRMRDALENKKQILLFMNRRGTAKLTLCSACEWQDDCLKCDLPLTFHHDIQKMICHICGYTKKPELVCPACNSPTEIRNLGSKALETDLRKLFPSATIGRYDSDNNKSDSFQSSYQSIIDGNIDILLGTQQIGKGLDIPNLTVVGILDADLSLHFPDFSSDERTFQLITQVIGRVGRRNTASHVVVQTYQPNNPVIKQALKQNWHAFYDLELLSRKKHDFPPFTHISRVITTSKSETTALRNASKLVEIASSAKKDKKIIIEGPIPSYIPKKGNNYYFETHLTSRSRNTILDVIKRLPKESIVDIDASTLL